MSTTVDQRVVQMQFDNKQFESNVSQTMSTLDKLKQKLNLNGAAKGLENVGTAAKKVDMSGLGAGVESVSMKFSALQVMGVTALANITNQAVNAGKRIASALTIDPIKTGFQEYETQINAVQTILANTSSKGTTIDDVNAALEELNKYADMTIYNFTEMTRNIGTFTAAGIDLDTSVNAIQGIANLAAVSGSTSQQASTAMYQLSQALAAGTIRLMDWNSVVNAGMGGEVFQNALKETSEALGTGAEAAIKATGSFRESLKEEWLTAEVLTETLKKFTSTGANEYVAEYTGLSVEAVEAALQAAEAQYGEADAIKYASEALAEKSGKNKDEIADILNFAKTATDAATKVKTFTQLWDVLKESAQSGWSQTWKLIVGDFEEAKNLLTPLADTLTGFINKMSDARNRVLQIALDFTSPWTTMMDKLNGSGLGKIKEVADSVGNLSDKLEYYQDIVTKVWRGDYNNVGDDPDRYDLLTKAGYDYRVVQDLVNKGYEYEITVEDIEASHKKFGLTMETTTEETKKAATSFVELSDEQLKNAGLTEEEISLYRAMEKEASRLGISVSELAEEMSNTNGRDMLIDSFKNIGNSIAGIGKAMKEAWVDIFNPPSLEEMGVRLYGLIRSLKDFTESLKLTDETGKLNENGQKIKRTFEGIFAAIDIVLTVVGGPLKIAFKLLTQLLGAFGFNILDVTAFIGDMLVNLRDFIDGALDFSGVFEKIANPIKNAYKSFQEWIASLKDSKDLPKDIAEGIAKGFGAAFTVIKNFFKKIPELFTNGFSVFSDSPIAGFADKLRSGFGVAGQVFVELGKIILENLSNFLSAHGFKEISADSIAGLVSGFREGAAKVWNAAVEMVSTLVQKVKDFLGIESPSKVFFAIGGFIIAGLIAGLQNGIPDSLGAVKDVFQPMLDWIKGLDFGAIMAAVMGIFGVGTAYKLTNALSAFASPFEGLGEVFEGTGEVLQSTAKVITKSVRPIKKILNNTAKVVKGFSNILNATAFSIRADGIKTLAEALLMLVGAIIVLTFFDPVDLLKAVGIIAALAVVLGVLAWAMNKMNSTSASIDWKKGIDIQGMTSGLLGVGIAILLMAATVKMIGSMDAEQAKQGFLGLAGLVIALSGVIAVFGLLVKGKSAQNMDKFGKTMTKLSIALLLISLVIKVLGGMDQSTLIQGGLAILAFSGVMVGLMAAMRLVGDGRNVKNIGSALLKIAIAIGVMGLVTKMLGELDQSTLIQGGIAIIAFSGVIVGLMAATRLIAGSKEEIGSIGGTLLKIALAIGVMAIITKMLGEMDTETLIRGGVAILAFSGIIVGLMTATKLIGSGKNIKKIGSAILGISGAIAIMALTAFMLSMISWEGFAKGTLMITAFAGIVIGLMAATKLLTGSKNVEKIGATLISVAGAIGILAVIAVLLGLVPIENLKRGIAAVTALSIVMALLIAVTGLAKNCLGNIIAITVAIAVLAGAVYLISTIPAESAITSAVILGGLLVVMTGVLAALAFIGKMTKDAMKGIFLLTAMAVPLLAFVGVLALMQNIENAKTNAIALTALATAMTLLLLPLTLVGALVTAALPGVIALTAMAVPLLAFVGVLALMQNIQNAEANANLLISLMTTMTKVLVVLALVGPLALVGVAAMTALTGLLVVVGTLATIVGGLVTQFPQLQTFIDTGIPILEQLASGLGRIIGGFIAAFAGEVMSILPELGLCLSQFMVNATPFIVGTRMIDESVLTGVGILAGAMLALTAADLVTGVMSFLQGGSSFADLGTQLSQFMINAMPFIMTAATITPEMLAGVKALAETILIITAADVLQGLTSFITGGSSLETFAAQLPILGQGLAAFSISLGAFTEEQLATVNCAANAIKTLAQASSEIPNTGGLLAQIVGENDLGTFASQFPILGTGLSRFLTNIGTFTDEQVATVTCAADAIKTLAQASSEIPNAGGLLGMLVGENDLGTFASQFPILGTGLRGFLDNIGTFTEEQVTTVTCAANAIKSLAAAASEIPNEGGWIAKLIGDNSLGTFAEQFPELGTGLRGFLDNVGTFTDEQMATVTCAGNAVKALAQASNSIDGQAEWAKKLFGDDSLSTFGSELESLGSSLSGFVTNLGTFTDSQVSTVNAAVKAIKALAGLANADLKGAKKHLSDLGDDLPGFASDVADFCTNMPSGESMTSAVSNINKLLNAVESIGNANSGCLADFADNLKKAGKDAVKKFVEAFTSGSAKSDMKKASKDLAQQAVEGIKDKDSSIEKAGKNAAKKAVDGVETQDDDMESAGKDLGKGLVKGINSKKTAAYNAGYALGQMAVQGEKDGQASNSPSKLTILAGEWLGEGLVIGMKNVGKSVYKAGNRLGDSATKSVSSTISNIASLISSDVDSQPTIRPVLDLSDVRTGINAIGGMFNANSSYGVQANVSAIATAMNRRNQNGVNSEVVSAIDKLSKKMDGLGNTTYNSIAGITYDEGSSVATAIETIARAALRERRV